LRLVCLLLDHELATQHDPDQGMPASTVQDYDGLYPFHNACQAASRKRDTVADSEILQVFRRFLVHLTTTNKTVDLQDYADSTPLIYLACSADREICLDMARELLAAGADIAHDDVTGCNALHAARRSEAKYAKAMYDMLLQHASKCSNFDMSTFDPDKRRGSSDAYHMRKGPQNRIPIEVRSELMQGQLNIAGIAQYIQRFQATHSRPIRIVVMTGAGMSY
jgi:hypothetical protein